MELLFILVIALVILGPDKMVDTGRLLGKALRDMRRATEEVTNSLSLEQELPRIGEDIDMQLDSSQRPEGSRSRDGGEDSNA